MKIKVLTLFPDLIDQALSHSIPSRAISKKLLEVEAVQLRDYAIDNRGTVDDTPCGGGAGMVLRVDVADKALQAIDKNHKAYRIILSPDGEEFNQKMAVELSQKNEILMLCGRYEGFDARIEKYFDKKVSIGSYVLSGGELAALNIIDATTRLIPGVLGNEESLTSETHNDEMSDYPQYTRPIDYNGDLVPEVLLSGNHAEVKKWREQNRKKLSS